MKKQFVLLLGLFCMLYSTNSLNAQVAKSDLKELNKILKSSIYQTKISCKEGEIQRMDDNGNIFAFDAGHVTKLVYDFDGLHNVVIWMKKGEKVRGVVNEKIHYSQYNVITFRTKHQCKAAMEILSRMFHLGDAEK